MTDRLRQIHVKWTSACIRSVFCSRCRTLTLGHSSVDITLRVYTHLLQKNNDEMLEIIEKSSQNLLDKNKKGVLKNLQDN